MKKFPSRESKHTLARALKRLHIRRATLFVTLFAVLLSTFTFIEQIPARANVTVGSGLCAQTVSSSTDVSVTQSGNDCLVTFSSSTAFTSRSNTWTVPLGVNSVQVLIVGGGGGAGFGSLGGGGGGGGVLHRSGHPVTPGTSLSIVVGAGGRGGYAESESSWSRGQSGANSSFDTFVAVGGGGGGGNGTGNGSGLAGGSGGGGSIQAGATFGTSSKNTYPSWTSSGNNGGIALTNNTGGGGGGAGQAGNTNGTGIGGDGISNSITGDPVFYGGGGGGWGTTVKPNSLGGGGGTGNTIAAGTAGTNGLGGGGGGGNLGGSGIVIVRYTLAAQAALSISTTTALLGQSLTLATSGGSGSGAVSYAVTASGTATCSVSASTLSFTRAGTCTVTATKAGANGYTAISSSATTITVSATVTYDSKGGSSVSSGTFTAGGSIAQPASPTRAGFTFGGWSATDGGAAVTWPYSPGGTSNITLYAKWTANQSIDYSLELSGTAGQYGQVSAGQILPASGAFTLETWFKPAADVSSNSNAVLISQGTSGGRFYLKRSSTGSMIYFREGAGAEATCGTAPGDAWAHIAITYSSGTTTCFLNGVQQSTHSASGSLLTGFVVGDYAASLNQRVNTWKGSIDEVRVYNTARTATQIAADAHAYATISDASLIAYYDFNEGSGATGFNQKYGAASATNLTLSGTPTFADVAETSNVNGRTVKIFKRSYLNNTGGWSVPGDATPLDVLAVGGGGAGGTANNGAGGGGGGGRVLTQTGQTLTGVLAIKIGQGGVPVQTAGATPGGNGDTTTVTPTTGSAISAAGGSGGATAWVNNPVGSPSTTGYNGGGGAVWSTVVTNGSAGVGGTSGGNAQGSGTVSDQRGGGGGGAGANGANGSVGGAGGAGVANAYATGSNVFYGGGGGGGRRDGGSGAGAGGSSVGGNGGAGSGSTSVVGGSAVANSGGGGGGAASPSATAVGGSGAAGIVVIRYGLENQAALTVTSTTGSTGSTLALTTSGGSGSGAVTFTATSGTAGCSVSGSTLSFTSTGTCTVTATKAAADGFSAVSSSATTITITAGIYTVTYNYDNATGGNSTATANFTVGGSALTLPTPTRTGHTFAGWYSDSAKTVSVGNAGASYSPTASLTLYAKWVSEIDYALDFDQSSASSSGRVIDSTAFSLEFWLKYDGTRTGTWRTIVNQYQSATNRIYISINTSNQLTYAYGGSTTIAIDTAEYSLPTNRWTHVALTRSSTGIPRLYVDGVLVDTQTTANTTLPTAALQVGSLSTEWFGGELDQLKIWGAELTQSEIRASMHSLAATQASGSAVASGKSLDSHYDFNEGTGSTIFDRIGGANLTTSGGTTTYRDVKTTNVLSGGATVVTFPRTYLPGVGGWKVPDGVSSVRSLVIAGGGGGGSDEGGGGGAGGLIATTTQSVSGIESVIVGQGGLGGWGISTTVQERRAASGQDSEFAGVSTIGGGAGGDSTLTTLNGQDVRIGLNGGSGGGAAGESGPTAAGGTGTVGQGNNGRSTTSANNWGGGGGGAGGAGGLLSSNTSYGGSGLQSNITGSNSYYAAGGSGGRGNTSTGSSPSTNGIGGAGGGDGSNATPGAVNTGSGGGGGSYRGSAGAGAEGGAGVVIVRYTIGYDISFVSGANGSGDDQSVTKTQGQAITLPNSSTANSYFTRTGFTITGWSTTDGGTQTHALGSSFTTDATTTFYPVWASTLAITTPTSGLSAAVDSSYTLSISTAGGAGTNVFTVASGTLPAGLSLDASTGVISGTPTTAGSQAITITVTDAASSSVTSSSFTIAVAAATLSNVGTPTVSATTGTLKSVQVSWASVANASSYSLKIYASNGTTLLDTITLADNLTSYTITSASGSFETIADATTYQISLTAIGTGNYVTSNESAKASVTTLATYTISYNANEATGGTVPANQTKIQGTDITLASNTGSLVRTGYSFDGWNTQANGLGTSYATAGSYSVDVSDELFAKWVANVYTVTYNYDNATGGNTTASANFTVGGSALVLPTPTRTGYTFAGWHSDSAKTVSVGNAGANYSPTASLTLYAKWNIISCNPTSSSITGYTVYVFTDLGTCTWTVPNSAPTGQALVVAGGGGGGSGGDSVGGGGAGAGGLIENNSVSLQSSIEITVGAGGSGGGASTWWTSGSNGQNSSIGSSLVAVGGGAGGGRASAGQVGGSGGGAGGRGLVAVGAAGTALQGNSGGGITEQFANGASGGGAGGSGGSSSQSVRGAAGAGKSSSITGSAITYAVGGVGGSRTGTSSLTTSNGTYGTGGAGSNGGYAQAQGGWGRGEAGANGVVIIRLPASNTVTYDSKGGSSVTSGSFITGGAIASAPTAPTRSGYTFDGWSATDGGTAITFPYSPGVASSITLYARWIGNSNTVTFDSKGGSSVANGSFLSGGSIATAPSPAPTRAGYTLDGWSATDGGSVVTFPYSPGVITGITLYAKWTANTNTVTYDSKGGTAVTSGSFTTGGSIANAPTDPTRTGYIFDGWTVTDGGSTVITFPYSPSATSAITLYAKWTEITYTITYDRNSATGSPERATDVYTYTGGAVTLATVGSMANTGYTFDGWQVSGTTTKLSSPYIPSANVTLEARWNAASYTVTYFSNSGGTAPSAGTYTTGNAALTLPTQGSMARAGYTFNGWSTTINDVSTKIAGSESSATLTTSAPVNLFALWTAINYTVTYCEESTCSNPAAFSGSVPVDASTYNIGNNVVVKANSGNLVRTGYSFAGWTIDSDGSGTALKSGQTYEVQSSNIRFYPQWSANTYTFTYNTNGATGSPVRATDTYITGNSATTLAGVGSMAKFGHTFSGWSADPMGSGQTSATTTSDVTLYAIWTVNSIQYTYRLGTVNSTAVNENFMSLVPSPLVANSPFNTSTTLSSRIDSTYVTGGSTYQFFGWRDNINGQTYNPGSSYLIQTESDIDFVAQWVQILEVRYAFNGGTGSAGNTAAEAECTQVGNTCLAGQTITLNTAPTRDGYTFTGWKDQTGADFVAGTSATVSNTSYLFYAQWQAVPYTMTFNSNGGDAVIANQVKNIGQSVTFPSPGSRTGYDFNGWVVQNTTSPTYGTGTSIVTGTTGINFVASWTPRTYTVTYNWNGGVGSPTNPANYTVDGTAITLPTGTNTRDGYVFDGWQVAGTTTKLTSPYAPTANTLLEARWLDGAYIITFDAKKNDISDPTSSVTRTTSLTLPTPTRAGFSFAGWYQDENHTLLYGAGGASVTPTASRTVYAKWTQNSLVGINPAHLNQLIELNAVAGSANTWTGSHALSNTGASLTVPADALPAGTKVRVSFVEDLTRPGNLIDGNNAYFTSVVVHWLTGSGETATVPDAVSGSPLSLTLTNPAIVAGAKVFKILNGAVTEVATATVDGQVTITFTQDPEFVVAATRPGSPTAVTATNNQNAQSTISWNAPLGNGGSSITGYTVTASPGTGTCTTNGTSCQITGLTNGTSYTFTVKATNAIGDSLPSSPSSAITPRLAINYNVTFNSNGGTSVGNSSFVENGTLSAPTDPTRAGFNFIGWATTDGNESTIISFPYSPSNADLTLYAIWRASNPALNPDNSGNNGAVITPISTKPSATPKASTSAKPTAQATSSAKPTSSASPAATPEPTQKDLFANAPKPNAGIDTPNQGDANAIVGDEPVETVITVTEFAKQIEIGDSISISFQATDGAGNQLPTSPDGSVQVVQGATISASGSGFKPDSPVEAWLYSTPVLLGSGLANADGSFDNTYAIDSDFPLGDHTVVLHGISPADEVITLALGVTVIADEGAAESSSNTLPIAILAFLGALLTVGLWLVLRRRSGTHKK